MRALITNIQLSSYTGSELASYDIALTFLKEEVRNSYAEKTSLIKESFSMVELANNYYDLYLEKISERVEDSKINLEPN